MTLLKMKNGVTIHVSSRLIDESVNVTFTTLISGL